MHQISTVRRRSMPVSRRLSMVSAAVLISLALAGCSGGADTMARATVPAAPAADLDTTKTPPQTVTSAPLLPPVPETGANQQSAQTEQPPLPYDGLATDEEQAKMQADLTAAAAKARQNN